MTDQTPTLRTRPWTTVDAIWERVERGEDEAAEKILAAHDREVAARALREAADVWQRGEWANAPRRFDQVQERIANGKHVSEWLRERAARLTDTTEDRKTADEWCQLLGVKIIDPDGWREDCAAWGALLTEAEFHQRAARSTVTPLTKTAACKHCRRAIETTAPSKGWIHADGHNKHLGRCNSVDSGLPYGYNAEPMGEPCRAPCLGTTTTEETT